MNYFKNNKLISLIVIFVLVINISALATLLILRFKEPQGPKPGPQKAETEQTTRILREELQFSDEQVRAFIQLQDEFLQRDESLRKKEAELKSELIGSLIHNNEIDADSSIALIAANVAEREKIAYDFFSDLKTLCSEEQQEDFHHLMGMFLRRLNPQHRPPKDGPHPRGDHRNPPPHPQGKPGERPPHLPRSK